MSRWLEDARALASPHLVVVLVGNKSDREEDRQVEWEEGSRWAAAHSMSPSERLLFPPCADLGNGFRHPLPRDVLAVGRQRRGAVPARRAIRFVVDRIWGAGPREGGQWCELRGSRTAARE